MRKTAPQPYDDAIDQALIALRNATSPEGLETRILASLRQREPLPPAARTHARRWLPAALTLATASALFALFLLRTSTHLSIPAPAPLPASARTPLRAATLSPLPPPARRTPALRTQTPHLPAPVQLTSFPAPPAPLTDQEKLLLQIAHRGERDDFNLLNPEAVARELAQNMAVFDHFFPPPPPFGPPVPQPSETPTPNPNLNQETPNEAHSMDR